jgi:hypothetical protein
MAQDDDDTQAICTQMLKAQATWARVGQVLRSKNASPFVAAKFYKAIIQAILLYGSKSCVISLTAMARLKGLHIRAAYRRAKEHKSKQGSDWVWIYPQPEDVLKEYRMKMMEEYILIRWQMVALYVPTCPAPTKCRQGKWKRGAIPHRWWWEQPMDLDVHDPIGSDE